MTVILAGVRWLSVSQRCSNASVTNMLTNAFFSPSVANSDISLVDLYSLI